MRKTGQQSGVFPVAQYDRAEKFQPNAALTRQLVEPTQALDVVQAQLCQEVTRRQQVEAVLHKQNEVLQKLLDSIPAMVNLVDTEGHVHLVNRAWEHTLGWSMEEIQECNPAIFVFCYPDPLYRQKVLDFIAASQGEWTSFKTRRRDGQVIDTIWRVVHLSEGLCLGIGQDITQNRHTQEILEQLAAIVEGSDDAIVSTTLDGMISIWNGGAERLYGYTSEEAIGQSISILIPPDFFEDSSHLLKCIERGEQIKSYETRRRRKDGSLVDISLTISPIRDARGRIVGASRIARDITERKRVEEVIRTFPRRLLETQEAERQRIARELHDEIGQVLTAVRVCLQLAWTKVCDPEAVLTCLSESMVIIDDTLSRVRELSLDLHPPILDDFGLCAALRWYVEQYSRRTGLRVSLLADEVERQERLPREIEVACFRIVQESLTNVVRHAQARYVVVSLRRHRTRVVLKICDDGVGLPPQPSERPLHFATLGLRGMEERALLAGGILSVSSGSRGTIICVRFPLPTLEH